LSTAKHFRLTEANKKPPKSPFTPNDKSFVCCVCGKNYKHLSSLCKHKKGCFPDNKNIVEQNSEIEWIQLIKDLVKGHSEFLEICKNGSNCNVNACINNINNNNNNNVNSNNKSFNLQFFLNETCKNAMNISEFADSIQLQLSDLESVGEMGYIEGISNIIVKNLSLLDINKRPIHCTDKKREVLYVKDENKWEKEDAENSKVRRLIKRVAFKNSSLMRHFREKYPDYRDGSSTISDKYNTIVVESMGGNDEKESKIIKNISKVVHL
jgi:hypothetical protein